MTGSVTSAVAVVTGVLQFDFVHRQGSHHSLNDCALCISSTIYCQLQYPSSTDVDVMLCIVSCCVMSCIHSAEVKL